MKTFRAHLTVSLAALAIFALSGCATTSQQSQSVPPLTNVYGIKKVQPDPTEGMNWMEKTGYYVGWIALESAYAFAAGNPAFSP